MASSSNSNPIRFHAGIVCIASAIVAAGQVLESVAFHFPTSQIGWKVGSEQGPFDFAHSVPLQRREYPSNAVIRLEPSRAKKVQEISRWYRYALPLSTTVFLLSFGIWSLQSQPNHAIRPLGSPLEELINRSFGDEYSDIQPTSVCPHAIEEPAHLRSVPASDPSR